MRRLQEEEERRKKKEKSFFNKARKWLEGLASPEE
jgi:cell division protein FtsA